MISRADRFWITFTIRFAFGFFFLIASINIFQAGGPHDFGPDWFAKALTKQYESGWIGQIPWVSNPFRRFIDPPKEETKTADAQASGDAAAPKEGAAAKEDTAAKEDAAASEGGAVTVEKVHPTYIILFLMPFIFAALAAAIIVGVFVKPALRAGALLLVTLGLGKYLAGGQELTTTANDFFFAFLICVALYFMAQKQAEEAEAI